MPMDVKTQVAIASAIVALGSAVVSAYLSYRNLRNARLDQVFKAIGTRDRYFGRLQSWAEEALGLMAHAVHLCDLDPKKLPPGEFFMKRHDLRVRLSAMIDKGRWFFPNVDYETHGTHKEEAYRGYRNNVLNGLMGAYRAVCFIDYADAKKNTPRRIELVSAQRLFTSEIQKVLDPRTSDQVYARLMESVGTL
jgi:hypothetical protein